MLVEILLPSLLIIVIVLMSLASNSDSPLLALKFPKFVAFLNILETRQYQWYHSDSINIFISLNQNKESSESHFLFSWLAKFRVKIDL